jgi:hypothetical protein
MLKKILLFKEKCFGIISIDSLERIISDHFKVLSKNALKCFKKLQILTGIIN